MRARPQRQRQPNVQSAKVVCSSPPTDLSLRRQTGTGDACARTGKGTAGQTDGLNSGIARHSSRISLSPCAALVVSSCRIVDGPDMAAAAAALLVANDASGGKRGGRDGCASGVCCDWSSVSRAALNSAPRAQPQMSGLVCAPQACDETARAEPAAAAVDDERSSGRQQEHRRGQRDRGEGQGTQHTHTHTHEATHRGTDQRASERVVSDDSFKPRKQHNHRTYTRSHNVASSIQMSHASARKLHW